MRLFIAIELDPAVRRHLVDLQDAFRPLAPSVSFTRADNLHITLKFLGEVADSSIKPLTDALAAIPRPVPFDTRVEGLECFPLHGPLRIVAARVAAPEIMAALHAAIEQACKMQGFPAEARPFRPHITLARARSSLPPSLRRQFDQAAKPLLPGPVMSVPGFSLMESRPTPSGSQYGRAAAFYI